MNRLIEDLRALHRLQRPRVVEKSRIDSWRKYSRSLWEFLKDPRLLVVTINGIAFYYYGCEQDFWSLADQDDFPDLTPPRPAIWFEYIYPDRIRTEGRVLELVRPGVKRFRSMRTGALVLTCKREHVTGEGIPEGTERVVMIDTFFDFGITAEPRIEGPHGAWSLALDKNGGVLEVPYCQSFTANNRESQRIVQDGIAIIHPPLLALSWLPRELPEDQTLIEL